MLMLKRVRPSIQLCKGNEKKRAEARRLNSFERFICERENFVFDSLIYLEPVERFKNRSNVMKFRSFSDSTSSRVKDKLKTILCVADRLSRRELQ